MSVHEDEYGKITPPDNPDVDCGHCEHHREIDGFETNNIVYCLEGDDLVRDSGSTTVLDCGCYKYNGKEII